VNECEADNYPPDTRVLQTHEEASVGAAYEGVNESKPTEEN